MAYSRVTPRARQGTTGINVEATAGNGVFINPPDRVVAVTIAVHNEIHLHDTKRPCIEP